MYSQGSPLGVGHCLITSSLRGLVDDVGNNILWALIINDFRVSSYRESTRDYWCIGIAFSVLRLLTLLWST